MATSWRITPIGPRRWGPSASFPWRGERGTSSRVGCAQTSRRRAPHPVLLVAHRGRACFAPSRPARRRGSARGLSLFVASVPRVGPPAPPAARARMRRATCRTRRTGRRSARRWSSSTRERCSRALRATSPSARTRGCARATRSAISPPRTRSGGSRRRAVTSFFVSFFLPFLPTASVSPASPPLG